MKRFSILVILFIWSSLIVSSQTVVEYKETDYINLRPQASDPDKDSLTYFFSTPLSSKGTWQTTYGDNGIYPTKVTVSDGRLLTTQDITLIIHKKEELPVIEILAPEKKSLYIQEGESIFFNIKAADLNKDELTTIWLLDGQPVSWGNYYTYKADYYSQGIHRIEAVVSDSVNNVSEQWQVEVEDFDRRSLLNDFRSLTIQETDLIQLVLPDFAKYGLYYNISAPLDEGKWQTTYDDSGLYTVTIRIRDNIDFEAEKKIKILVENIDRSVELSTGNSFWISENEQLEIFVNYIDPDGDKIELKAYNLPQGAQFHDNTIKWLPDFNVVAKESIFDNIALRYHVMSRQFVIYINATSNNLRVIDPITVRVFNNNRPPILEDVAAITIYEGEIINYQLFSYDPDNGALYYSFDGFKNGYKTRIGEAGTYNVKITVSDGFLKDTKYTKVTILAANLPPTLKKIPPKTVDENELIEILLEAKDPNKDELLYSAEPMPRTAYFKANKFIWTPPYDSVSGEEGEKTFEFIFKVSDGSLNTTRAVPITINNVNRAPKLTSSAQIDAQEFYTGEPITFYIDIFDPDNDKMTYTWKTSLFNKFEGTDSIAVKYSKPGKKKVTVIASDGKESVQREWEFTVKKKPKISLVYLR